jgi:cobaltochelatase CobN
MREFFERSNPWALQAIAERLLEANERGLWDQTSPETLAALQELHAQSEEILEARSERV